MTTKHACVQCGAVLTKKGIDINDINEEIDVFIEKYPEVDVVDQLERFINYLGSHNRRYKNYIMAFHNWCKRAIEMSPGKPVSKLPTKNDDIDWKEIAEGAYHGK